MELNLWSTKIYLQMAKSFIFKLKEPFSATQNN